MQQQQMAVEAQNFPVLNTRVLSAIDGIHLDLTRVMKEMPVRTEADVHRLLARITAYPARVQQDIALLKEGARLGCVTHQASLMRVPEQIDALLSKDVRSSPLFAPFKKLLDSANTQLSDAQRTELSLAGERALSAHAQPPLRALRRFVVDELLPRSPRNGALSSYPGGSAVYDYAVRNQTTTELSAQTIHALGLNEVARLRTEMENTMKLSGFKEEFTQFVNSLNTDPQFFYVSGDGLLAGYRDIAKRVDPELPKLFSELPRMP